jgi:hypothetical protein
MDYNKISFIMKGVFMPYVEDIRRVSLVRRRNPRTNTESSETVTKKVYTVRRDSIPYLIVSYILTFLEFILGLRLVLSMLSASRTSAFVDGIYTITQPLVRPFAGIFPSSFLRTSVPIEWAVVAAMVLYALCGFILMSLFSRIGKQTPAA